MIKTTFKPGSRTRSAVIAIVFFAIADNLNYLTRALGMREYMAPMAVTGIRDVVEVILCFAGIEGRSKMNKAELVKAVGQR